MFLMAQKSITRTYVNISPKRTLGKHLPDQVAGLGLLVSADTGISLELAEKFNVPIVAKIIDIGRGYQSVDLWPSGK